MDESCEQGSSGDGIRDLVKDFAADVERHVRMIRSEMKRIGAPAKIQSDTLSVNLLTGGGRLVQLTFKGQRSKTAGSETREVAAMLAAFACMAYDDYGSSIEVPDFGPAR